MTGSAFTSSSEVVIFEPMAAERDFSTQSDRVHQGVEALSRLHDLGLTPDVVAAAVRDAATSANSTTPLHPRTSAGIYVWSEGVHSLRQQLVPEGWEAADDQNFALISHPTGSHAISVAGASAGTGIPTMIPRTASAKGVVTRNAVAQNQRSFWDDDSMWAGGRPSAAIQQVWLLLIHLTPDGEVRSEVSLPSGFTGDRVAKWRERILLPPLRLTEPVVPDSDFDDDADDVVPRIERRAQ